MSDEIQVRLIEEFILKKKGRFSKMIEIFSGLFMRYVSMNEDTLRKDLEAELRSADQIKSEMSRLSGGALVEKTKQLAACYGRIAELEKQLNVFEQLEKAKKGESNV